MKSFNNVIPRGRKRGIYHDGSRLTTCRDDVAFVKRVRPLMGTYVEIELRAKATEAQLNTWITEGFEAVAHIDRLMSRFREDSDVSCINRAQPGVWVEVHPHSAKVLQASNELYQASDGIFDIRCGPSEGGLPIEVRDGRACKAGNWALDFGGIAKGYAVDCAVERIRKVAAGFETTGVVNASGDLRVWGDERAKIAARMDERTGSWLRPFDVKRTAIATSMVRPSVNAEQFSSAMHLRMPKGKPLRKANPVTVFAEQCVWADALTKIVLLGSENLARKCLNLYDAHALVFGSRGDLMRAFG